MSTFKTTSVYCLCDLVNYSQKSIPDMNCRRGESSASGIGIAIGSMRDARLTM